MQLPADFDRHGAAAIGPHEFRFDDVVLTQRTARARMAFELAVLGHAQFDGVGTQQFLAPVTQHAAGALADVDDAHGARIDQEDGVGGCIHGAAKTLQLGGAVAHGLFHVRAVVACLALQQAHLEHVVDAGQHFDGVEGFIDEVACTRFDGAQLQRRIRRHGQHRQPGVVMLAQRIHDGETVEIRHVQVEHDQVEAFVGVRRGNGTRICGTADGHVPGTAQQIGQGLAHREVIIDQQDARLVDVILVDHVLPLKPVSLHATSATACHS
jgi:hypothetical protein